jgi:HK97 family phage prohead protease
MEYKSLGFEIKELSKESRTAVIAHAVYNSIDRMGDVARKGMFNKSWREKKDIAFLFNHDDDKIAGNVLEVFEDEHKAYTKVKFGNWKLGDDLLEMVDAGVIRGASFGFYTTKKEYKMINGRKVRELKEVIHDETSLLTKIPAHPQAGIVHLTKANEGMIKEFKASIDNMERFCRNANASDETIMNLLGEIEETKSLIQKYDTAATQVAIEQDASISDNDTLLKGLLLLNAKI